MNQKVCILILLFIKLFSQVVFAQEKYDSAIVVLQTGDTVSGFVDNQNWRNTPSQILFKRSPSEKEVSYLPGQLLSFEFPGGDSYVSKDIVLHYYTDDISELEDSKDTLTRKGFFFLQVLYTGRANLYLYVDDHANNHFFIEKDGSKTDELVLKRMISSTDNGVHSVQAVATINKYQQSLSYYFADCQAIISKIKACDFSEKDLTRLFDEYSACFATKGNVKKVSNQKIKFNWGPVLGMAASTVHFSADSYGISPEAGTFSYSFDPVAGLRFVLALPRNNRTYSFVNDVLYTSYYVTNEYQELGINYQSVFDFSYLKIHSQLQFDLNNKENRPYIKLGIGNNFILKHEAYQWVDYGEPYATKDPWIFTSPRTHELSFIASAGAKIKRFQFELTFEDGNGFTYETYTRTTTISFEALLAYLF